MALECNWKCQECGKKFKKPEAAERASRNGCPKCGGVDIDLDVTDLKAKVWSLPAEELKIVTDRRTAQATESLQAYERQQGF